MNNSGMGIASVLKSHNLNHRNLIVVYDELALPWTALRIKLNGSAAGHNGVKSMIAALKTEVFTRVRVGIHPGHDIEAVEYVLAPFARGMRDEVEEMVSYTADAVETILAEGAYKAMTKFNRRARGSKKRKNENLRRVVHCPAGCHRRRIGSAHRTVEACDHSRGRHH